MHITVPLRKHKQLLTHKKHQQFLFKQIQYNSIVAAINQRDLLRQNTHPKPLKLNITPQCSKNTQRTLRKTSIPLSSNPSHRPSFHNLLSAASDTHSFSKTPDTTQNYTLDHPKTLTQPSRIHPTQSLPSPTNKPSPANLLPLKSSKSSHLHHTNRLTLHSSSSKHPNQTKNQNQKLKKKKLTLFGLKLKNIEQIVKNSGRSEHMDFVALVERDQKSITKSYWTKFYSDIVKNQSQNSTVVQEKIQKLRKAATSHQKINIMQPQNSVQELFMEKKRVSKGCKQGSKSLAVSRGKQDGQKRELASGCVLESQKMWGFYNFVCGMSSEDEYSRKMSLRKFRSWMGKSYILKNSEEAIKESREYKKITMENFKKYKPEEILFFIYLHENQYKLQAMKNDECMREVVP